MRASGLLFILLSLPTISVGCAADDPDASREDDTIATSPLRITLEAEGLGPGESLTGVVRLGEPAPPDGAVIMLSSTDDDALTIPDTITVAASAHTAQFNVSNSYRGKRKLVKIFAAYQDAWTESHLFVPSAPAPICNLHVCSLQ